ncbi:Hypothetical protein HDN1F_14520 [gamma proteobacterium HdN1]|nr:Hypothetical protein HDN1F_14520 [gamma proteobacterium HdN1]
MAFLHSCRQNKRSPLRRPIASIFALTASVILLNGCETLGYYVQAAQGQWELMSARQPIPALIANPDTPESLRHKLALVQEARAFAQTELQLKADESYTSYVQLDRPYVVWNVFAAPEFSIQAQQWCFPIAGCVAYRGYFHKADAARYALQLSESGLETWVSGVSAYSTLGWFDDPLLSSVIHQSDTELAALIFHELAHQTLYISGKSTASDSSFNSSTFNSSTFNSSTFNESYATVIEQEGIRRWLKAHGQPQEWPRYLQGKARNEQFIALILDYRKQLDTLYRQDLPDLEKRRQKSVLAENLRNHYKHIKESEWQGFSGYDAWMQGPLNNAQISTIATYHELVPALNELLDECSGEMACFHRKARRYAEKNGK